MPKATGSPCCGTRARSVFIHPPAVEDYLAAIYRLNGRREETSTTTLAARLSWALPAVSAMYRRQGAAGLVIRPTAHRAELTEHGRYHAGNVVRRNRLVNTLLTERLSLQWTQMPAEADRLEHVVGQRTKARLDVLSHDARAAESWDIRARTRSETPSHFRPKTGPTRGPIA